MLGQVSGLQGFAVIKPSPGQRVSDGRGSSGSGFCACGWAAASVPLVQPSARWFGIFVISGRLLIKSVLCSGCLHNAWHLFSTKEAPGLILFYRVGWHSQCHWLARGFIVRLAPDVGSFQMQTSRCKPLRWPAFSAVTCGQTPLWVRYEGAAS